MRRQFVFWAVLAGVLLGGSSVVGTVVKAVIRPKQYDYTQMWRPPAVAMTAVRTDLTNARPPEFRTPQSPDPTDATTFQGVLDGVADLGRQRNFWGLQQYFDFDRMSEELVHVGVYAAIRRQPTHQSVADDAQTLQNAVNGLLGRADGSLTWDRVQVVRVAKSASGQEALVTARHFVRVKGGGERAEYRRWWLRNAAGAPNRVWAPLGWRVYDFDEPDTRLRYTLTQGGVLADGTALGQPGPGGGPMVLLNTPNGVLMVGGRDDEGVVEVRKALAAAADGDRAAAAAAVKAAGQWQMIPALAAVRDAAEGRLLLLDRRPQDALNKFGLAKMKWADTPAAELGRAAALNDLKQYAEAKSAVGKYRAVAGDDPEAVREHARALAGLGDATAAVEALRAGVKEFPGAVGLLAEWYRVSPPGQRAEAGELAANAPDPGETLTKLLRRIEPDDPTGAGAAAVVGGYRLIRPKEPVGLVAHAAALVRQGRPADAAGPLREGLAGLEEEPRAKAVDEFARSAVRAGKAAEGYDAAAKAGQAAAVFRPLAEAAVSAAAPRGAAAKDQRQLTDAARAVIAAHAAAHPADPWPDYHAAGLHMLAGEYAAAEKRLADGMAKLPPTDPREVRLPAPGAPGEVIDPREADRNRFRSQRAVCLYKLGQWRRAYDELPPRVDTFDQLARLLAADKKVAELAALVAAHEKAVPGDAEAVIWRAQVHFLKGEYPAAVAACLEYGQKAPNAAVPLRVTETWVRSLCRLGRPAEAVAMAEAADADAAGVALRAVVAASSGDVAATREHLRELRRQGRSAADIYADPDLGPLLRAQKFAGLWKEFPPPKK